MVRDIIIGLGIALSLYTATVLGIGFYIGNEYHSREYESAKLRIEIRAIKDFLTDPLYLKCRLDLEVVRERARLLAGQSVIMATPETCEAIYGY